MKKETLEEAAEKYADFSNDYVPMSFGDKFNETTKRDFIKGAKWQEERMYSEEEVILLIAEAICKFKLGKLHDEEQIIESLEKFKKK